MRHSLALGRLLLCPHALEFLRRRFLCDRLLDRHEFSRRCAALGPGARAAQFRLYLAALFHRTLARVVAHRLVHRHVSPPVSATRQKEVGISLNVPMQEPDGLPRGVVKATDGRWRYPFLRSRALAQSRAFFMRGTN